MWTHVAVIVVSLYLCGAQQQRWIKFPAGTDDGDQCYDTQIDRTFDVGSVWSSPFSGCKQSYCVRENGVIYIDRYQCPSVVKQVDFKKLKANNLSCRQAQGDRRRGYPECCPSLVCKHYVHGKLVALPKDKYPLL